MVLDIELPNIARYELLSRDRVALSHRSTHSS
jgi:hypothetical protein